MIKRNRHVLLLLAAAVFFISMNCINTKNTDDRIRLSVKTFATDNGWGYNVLADDRIYIHQQYIPAVEGNKVFSNKQQAESVGLLVVHKLTGKLPPTISVHELDSCRINY